jgi:hypothetical protein
MLLLLKEGAPESGDVHVNGPLPGKRTPEDIEAERIANLRTTAGAVRKRDLQPHDVDTSKAPFMYDPHFLGSLRPDQVPRFYGALTDSEKLPRKTVNLHELHATQDRVLTAKVEAIRRAGAPAGKLPVVVRHQGKQYIADGHHRLAADWLSGERQADVRYKDLEPVSSALKSAENSFGTFFKVSGVDDGLGLVFGWGIVCTEDGKPYFDVHKNHIPEDAMVEAVTDFMKNSRGAGEQHERMDAGTVVHSFPLTAEIASAMGIGTDKTGWMIAMAPDPAMLAKFKSGELTGFSIGGTHLEVDGKPVQ